MEDKYTMPIVSAGALLSSMVAIVLYLWFNKYIAIPNKGNYRVPPGSNGWPFVGHAFSWFFSFAKLGPRTFLRNHVLPYGDIVTCNLFGRHTVVSVDPEFNKFVLQNEGRLFQASYFKSLTNIIGKYGMLSVHGELQRKLHGIALLVNMMAKHLLNVTSEKEIDELYFYMSNFINGIISIPIKMLGCAYAKGLKAREFLIGKISELIEERRKNPDAPRTDLLTKLLKEGNLKDEIMADFLVLLLVASYETAARAMTVAIHFLTHSPKALEQLRDEHNKLRECRGEDKLNWQDYKSMKFTQCVINETLRISSIAMGLIRETTEDVTIKGYVIPKGWGVMTFLGAVHLNDNFYPDALKFDPWRWQGTETEGLLWKNNDMLFTPFGGGGRLCPGADLARLGISLFLHHFVTKFRWDQLKEDEISYFPITHMASGFPIRVLKRGD
eukprot:Gb_24909 [translate_table: standard]